MGTSRCWRRNWVVSSLQIYALAPCRSSNYIKLLLYAGNDDGLSYFELDTFPMAALPDRQRNAIQMHYSIEMFNRTMFGLIFCTGLVVCLFFSFL